MSRFCIDSSVLGTKRHFISDDGFRWSDSVPRDTWHMTGTPKDSPAARCLDTLFALIGHVPAQVPKKYITAMNCLVSGSHEALQWQHILPAEAFQEYFKNIIQDTSSIFPNLPIAYYDAAWTAGSRVLTALKPAKIDLARWQELSSDQSQNQQAIESFRPGRTGYARPAEYDRFGTRTGRMTTPSGPQILTLKKSNKNMIKSAFTDGIICTLDYRALEARIVLSEAGKSSDSEDMYAEIARDLFDGKVERDTVKTAVISELYGISRGALAIRLQVPGDVLDKFITVVRSHFGILALKSRLKAELKENGFIKNRFGRPLRLEETQDNLLVNTYSQSSGVDIAMLGFDTILQELGPDGIRPLFILHDAIILDVRGDRITDVQGCTSVLVPTYEHKFPLKYDQIV